jgi:aminoglycoside phosphotransferase (APT) family kinase protein
MESGMLVHPTLPEQLELLTASLEKVVPEAVNRVLAPLGLQCRKLTRFTESQGVINPIFFVEAGATQTPDASVELVLRVTNPHMYWQRRKTAHEVAVMEFVRTHANPDLIPVPRVVAFSADASASPLGCEFVLMDKIKGENLGDVRVTSLAVLASSSTHIYIRSCGKRH